MAVGHETSLGGSEAGALGSISSERLMDDSATLAQWEKVSGTPGERLAVEHLAGALRAMGLEPVEHRFESLIGTPEGAELHVTAPDRLSFEALTNSFAPSTPPDGLEGAVVYAGAGSPSDLAGVAGRIAVLEGMASPLKVLRASEAGAVGLIFIQGDRLHNMCVSPIWGTPTPRTAHLIPKVPSLSIRGDDGERLRQLVDAGGEVRVRMTTRTTLGWREVRLLTAQLNADVDTDEFVLLSGHHCSWHLGAMDNGTANATMLETMRVLAQNRRLLKRHVRVAFWPGHSQGRYSGSTWYFDHFWQDLHDNCVLHLNCDSTGARGAVYYRATGVPEAHAFGQRAIRDAVGFDAPAERQTRNGDESFYGAGVPSLFMDISLVPGEMAAARHNTRFGGGERSESEPGLPWFWHTPDDTIDKIDPDVLVNDTRVYVLATLRAGTAGLLPMRYDAAARDIRTRVAQYQEAAKGRFDASPAMRAAEAAERDIARLHEHLDAIAGADDLDESRLARVNAALHSVGRDLVLVNFTSEGPFEQDLAIPMAPVPLLAPMTELEALDPRSDAARFLATQLTRAQNKFVYVLGRAGRTARDAVALLRDEGVTPV